MCAQLQAAWNGLRISFLVLALILGQMACHSWYPIQSMELKTGKQDRDHNLELTYADGRVVLAQPYELDYPKVTGRVLELSGTPMGWTPGTPGLRPGAATFDLEQAQLVRLWKVSPWKAVALSVGIPVGILAILIATKQSCPFVYVDEGTGARLVGEGYPSAIYRSIQREDVLQLPIQGHGDLRLRLANLVDETQYTDRLDLFALDHGAGEHALATADAKVVLLGPARAPLAARDLDGTDCRELVAAVDQKVWKTDLQRAAAQGKAPVREGLTATFAPIAGHPVLEVQLRSTRWLETVTGRYFAAMGDQFPDLLERLNAAEAQPIQEWRHKEGIDLQVEVQQGGRWRSLGFVHPTGAACYRRVALPFPEDWREPGPIQVRLTGGTGFWWVDALALAPRSMGEASPFRVPMSSAQGQDGADQLGVLDAVDGRFHVMSQPGEQVEARFSLPPIPAHRTRTVFMRIHGYYNPHAPVLPRKSLWTLNRMLHEEGAFVRFGLDLYRENRNVLHGSHPDLAGAGLP